MHFELKGGPCDGWRVPAKQRRGNEIRLMVGYQGRLSLTGPIEPLPPPREAIYRIADDETGVAAWLGWQDELVLQPSPLADAMANATDDEILALLDAASEATRKRPNIS